MFLVFPVLVFSIVAVAQSSIPQTSAQVPGAPVQTSGQATTPAGSQQAMPDAEPARTTQELPASPRGKSTVIGGVIQKLDPVRDQFMLKVFGSKKPMKILFDERTQAFRDGTKISVLGLHPNEHASVETTLDGTKVFALRIRVLSKVPVGDGRGVLVSYDAAGGKMTFNTTTLHEPITLTVPPSTPVVRLGQLAKPTAEGNLSQLVPGSLIDAKFTSGPGGGGIATEIDLIAVPGATFSFSGTIETLNLNTGLIVLAGPGNSGTQDITFDPLRFPESKDLHEGSTLRVDATFDGTRYVASTITVQ